MKHTARRTYRMKGPKLTPGRRLRLPTRPRLAPALRGRAAPALSPLPPEPEPLPRGREAVEARPNDTLQLYYREIGRVKLLTRKEEVELARRIRKGDEAARDQMIQANLRLVVKIAREYEGLGLPLLDLINEGNIGLMKGVERFDPARGTKLSTYASWWIKQSIKRALANQSKTIRLPIHVVDKVAHVRRAELRLRETLQREPTQEELAAESGLPARRVREYLEAARAPVSLDAPLGPEDEGNRVAEVVADANAITPLEYVSERSDTELLREVLATLTPREQEILTLRFGMKNGTPKTLEVIGKRFGVTRERIRQIESEALATLRRRMERRDRFPSEAILALSA